MELAHPVVELLGVPGTRIQRPNAGIPRLWAERRADGGSGQKLNGFPVRARKNGGMDLRKCWFQYLPHIMVLKHPLPRFLLSTGEFGQLEGSGGRVRWVG